MKKYSLVFVLFIFGLIMSLSPEKALAIPMADSHGSAVIDWTSLTINITGDVAYSEEALYSEVEVLNATEWDGGVGVVSASAQISNAVAGAQAYSNSSEMIASGNVATPPSIWGDSWAYAERTGYFEAGAAGGSVTISVDYTLGLDLNTELGGIAEGDTGVILWIENFWSGDSDSMDSWLSGSVMDGDFFSDSSVGTLEVLLAFDSWDTGSLGIAASNYVYATTPEPGTLILLGSGLLGMGIFRRKRKV